MGDVWMRLMTLLTLSKMDQGSQIEVAVAPSLLAVARILLRDRLALVSDLSGPGYIFTHRGPSDLWQDVLNGRKMALPFARVVQAGRAQTRLKRALKAALMTVCDQARLLFLPPPGLLNVYHGLMQVQAVPELRHFEWSEFKLAAKADMPLLRERMRTAFPAPKDGATNTVVYPSGHLPPDPASGMGCKASSEGGFCLLSQ